MNTHTQTPTTTVRSSVVIEAPIERAFKAFQLEHRYLDRHGEGWEGLREGVGGDGGWPLYLQRYGALSGRED